MPGFFVEPSDNANQAVPSLNDLFKSGGVEGHASKGDYNQLCSEAARQLAVFLNFPTVLRTVRPSSTDKNSLWGVKTLVDTDLDKQGHLQFKGENVFKAVSTTRMKRGTRYRGLGCDRVLRGEMLHHL